MGRRVLDYGDGAVLVECADETEVRGLRPVIKRHLEQVGEIVPGARSLLLRLDWPLSATDRATLEELSADPTWDLDRPAIVIGVAYAKAGLTELAHMLGLSADAIVEAHTGQIWTVVFNGPAPGFGHLTAADDTLRLRRRTPYPGAERVIPAGAVALSEQWCGVFPQAVSPSVSQPGSSDWTVIGHTDEVLWDLDRDQPALLRPGGRVRFVAR